MSCIPPLAPEIVCHAVLGRWKQEARDFRVTLGYNQSVLSQPGLHEMDS